MNEEKVENVFEGLSSETLELFDKYFGDEEEFSNSLMFAALLQIPDQDFEVLRPLIQEEMIKAYNEPQNQMVLVQSLAQSGISVNEILNYTDELTETLLGDVEIELSESKKDFIRTLFTAIANSISSSTINPAHIVEIPIEICRENAKLPTYATDGSAAMDLYAPEEYNLAPGECAVVPLGFKVAIPHGYALLIQPRSGLSRRTKLRLPNSPGLIDEDYHEEVGVIIENIDPPIKEIGTLVTDEGPQDASLYGSTLTIGKGERFAQMRLVEVPRIKWREVKSLGNFDNNHGEGFGSTGSE
jgi:dUTP pyrophosphatase